LCRTGKVARIRDAGSVRTPSVGTRVDRDAGRAQAAIEQDLDERPAEGMADQDRRALELGDDARQMLDRVGHGDALDRSGIGAQRLNFNLETRIGGAITRNPRCS